MNNQEIKVQIVYRNYKGLHPLFKSYIESPASDVRYVIPDVVKGKRIGFSLYRKIGNKPGVPALIDLLQKYIFTVKPDPSIDLIEYIQIVPKEIPAKPYIVDVEHAGGLFNFLKPSDEKHQSVLRFLTDKNCKRVICTSKAAKDTFPQYFTKEQLDLFSHKLEVVYPALNDYYSIYKDKIDHSLIKKSEKLKILFVGNDVYRKGLHEILEAFTDPAIRSNSELHINSNIDDQLKTKYTEDNIFYYDPIYTHTEMITKFFLPADIFVMPTHADTFGMVYLDALATRTPLIVTNQFATPEMIEDGKGGLFVASERLYLNENKPGVKPHNYKTVFPKEPEEMLVKNLKEVLRRLINDRSLLDQIREGTNEQFQDNNKFSIKRRNNQLGSIIRSSIASA